MPTIDVRDATGAVIGPRELPGELFEATVNVPAMHQVVVAGMAAQRAGTHSTKTRGEVAGGSKKPWRQKGTGRARQGSTRAPHWSGGGVAHGPVPHGHEIRVNKKLRKVALRSALTDAMASGKLAVVGELSFEEPRTKDAVGVIDALGLRGRLLLVLPAPDEVVEKSFQNLPQVKVDYPGNLSTYDVLYADAVLFTSGALDVLTGETWELPSKTAEETGEGVPGDEASAEVEAQTEEEEAPPEEAPVEEGHE